MKGFRRFRRLIPEVACSAVGVTTIYEQLRRWLFGRLPYTMKETVA